MEIRIQDGDQTLLSEMEIRVQDVYWWVLRGLIPVQAKGRKQGWAEGDTSLWCSFKKDSSELHEKMWNLNGLPNSPLCSSAMGCELPWREGWTWARWLFSSRAIMKTIDGRGIPSSWKNTSFRGQHSLCGSCVSLLLFLSTSVTP